MCVTSSFLFYFFYVTSLFLLPFTHCAILSFVSWVILTLPLDVIFLQHNTNSSLLCLRWFCPPLYIEFLDSLLMVKNVTSDISLFFFLFHIYYHDFSFNQSHYSLSLFHTYYHVLFFNKDLMSDFRQESNLWVFLFLFFFG